MLNKMKSNYSLLNKGEENSTLHNSENKHENPKSKQSSNRLINNFRNYRKNNSAIIFSKNPAILKPRKPKIKLFKKKNNSFLDDITKITPKLNLQYRIELYEQKGRYSLVKKDEIIDENKYSGNHFINQQYKDSYSYKTSLNLKGKKKFYISNQKSISYGKFRPSIINGNSNSCFLFEDNISFNNNKYTDISISQIKNKNNKKRIKSSTKSSTKLTNQSILFSDKMEIDKIDLKYKKEQLNFKNKCIRLKYQINNAFEKAHRVSMNLTKDIYESKKYDKFNKLGEKPKKIEKQKLLKIININKNKIKDNKDDLYKYLDIEKNVENKIIKSSKYYDKLGKRLLKEVMGEEKKEQHFLNKKENSKNIILNSRFFIKKLQNELSILGANILATKKKYKGERAIEPNNEIKFLHKLIKENSLKINDEGYLGKILKRRNESMSNRIKKRLLSLQQRSLSIKNKLRESDYDYSYL